MIANENSSYRDNVAYLFFLSIYETSLLLYIVPAKSRNILSGKVTASKLSIDSLQT